MTSQEGKYTKSFKESLFEIPQKVIIRDQRLLTAPGLGLVVLLTILFMLTWFIGPNINRDNGNPNAILSFFTESPIHSITFTTLFFFILDITRRILYRKAINAYREDEKNRPDSEIEKLPVPETIDNPILRSGCAIIGLLVVAILFIALIIELFVL